MPPAAATSSSQYWVLDDVGYKPSPGADRFENGRVFPPVDAPWLDDYIVELIGFPSTTTRSTQPRSPWIICGRTCTGDHRSSLKSIAIGPFDRIRPVAPGDNRLVGYGSRPTLACCYSEHTIVEYWRCDPSSCEAGSPPLLERNADNGLRVARPSGPGPLSRRRTYPPSPGLERVLYRNDASVRPSRPSRDLRQPLRARGWWQRPQSRRRRRQVRAEGGIADSQMVAIPRPP
jgi:hypothetical protein